MVEISVIPNFKENFSEKFSYFERHHVSSFVSQQTAARRPQHCDHLQRCPTRWQEIQEGNKVNKHRVKLCCIMINLSIQLLKLEKQ